MASFAPRLIAITDFERFDVEQTLDAFEELCLRARPQTVCVQLRSASVAGEQLQVGLRLRSLVRRAEQLLCVNERLDVGLALGAEAIHLKATSVPADAARALWTARGKSAWVSRAWHIGEPIPTHVDALIVSPVFGVRKGRPPLWEAGWAEVVKQLTPLPVYALGGVGPHQAALAMAAGASGVAAMGACYTEGPALLESLRIVR